MCKYCDTQLVNKEHACPEYFIHKSFRLIDEHTKDQIKDNGDNPVMYLREYRKPLHPVWSLVVEFADEKGTVVESAVLYCPRCGRLLLDDQKEIEELQKEQSTDFREHYLWE